MPTDVQFRRAAQATQEARALVAGSGDINLTDNRWSIHDGSTVGGHPHCTWRDQQNNEFSYVAGSGTNSITASFARAPGAQQQGQIFWVKIANNNTGAVTFNPDSLGAKTVKKAADGTLADLEADDLVQGAIVGFADQGTYYVVVGVSGGGGGAWEYETEVSLSGSATAIFSGLPADVTDIDILVKSMSGQTEDDGLQIGDSGGIETSGYLSDCYRFGGGAIATNDHATNCFVMYSAAETLSGVISLRLQDIANNDWVCSYVLGGDNTGVVLVGGGNKALSAAITQGQIIGNGSQSGSVTARWRAS